MSSMNLFEGKTQEQIVGIRAQVEKGLQDFNAIQDQIMHDAVAEINANGVRFNPEIGRLSDFVNHCKLLISINDANADIMVSVESTLKGVAERFQKESYNLSVNKNIGDIITQISLVLRIGEVFNVPVFTVYIMRNVFDNAQLNSEDATQIVASPLTHNLKTISTCSRVDLMLELLLHATQSDPYDAVNVLISHSINELIILKFGKDLTPNEVIAAERAKFFGLLVNNNEPVKSLITKSLLIAIIQNPSIMTYDGKRFSDIFPSGQYGQYFGDVVHRASFKDQGPIMIRAAIHDFGEAPQAGEAGEAPDYESELRPILASEVPSHPLTRTDIIVAALTAANDAMSRNANIVAAGGAAVSYYINDFMNGMNAYEFGGVIPDSGLDDVAVADLVKGCNNIPMNDIDCFVFGDVSRQFLMLFSLYMMILYANFYERPKQYGVINEQVMRIQFRLSPQSSDNVDLFMYGDHNEDANTRLISKTLKKNPKVQLVTQETKCFSQLSSPLCGGNLCTVDGYYTQPIDLVKKDIEDFLALYESLYLDTDAEANADAEAEKPDLRALLTSQYAANVDNMVSMKTTMLDLVCIFCNEDKALFIRIFMARKNPKDFARLRVFIEIYLLQLLRANDATFLKYKEGLIGEITQLRIMMRMLNDKYYLEQGNLAAVHADTADKLNADRADFLKLLRSIGRKIVLIPDPLKNNVPATFSKETGRTTIVFFKDKLHPQMKYPFKLDQHMFNLYDAYTVDRVTEKAHVYDAWLAAVFQEMPFVPNVEHAFREKLGKIIDKNNNPIYFEVGFADMRVKTTEMLKLLTALNQSTVDEETIKGLTKHQRRILPPLRKHIAMFGPPKASYVHNIFNKRDTLLPLLPEFIKDLLKTKDPALLKTIDAPKKYDDAVQEAIGNVILKWNQSAPDLKGGATRKRKRACKRNAKTRKHINKRMNTRRKTKANCKRNRSRRRA